MCPRLSMCVPVWQPSAIMSDTPSMSGSWPGMSPRRSPYRFVRVWLYGGAGVARLTGLEDVPELDDARPAGGVDEGRGDGGVGGGHRRSLRGRRSGGVGDERR